MNVKLKLVAIRRNKCYRTGTWLIHSIPIGNCHTWSKPGYRGTNVVCWCRWVGAREDGRNSASSTTLAGLTFYSLRDHKVPQETARRAQSHRTSRSGSSFILLTVIKTSYQKSNLEEKRFISVYNSDNSPCYQGSQWINNLKQPVPNHVFIMWR